MQQHFVTFLSPGSFVHEQTVKQISSWNTDVAMEMARDIVERYNARPFAFYFTTRSRDEHELDSKVSERSCTYFLGGEVRTAEEVLAGTDPEEDILRHNVKANGINRIIVNRNSFRSTHVLEDNDVVLDFRMEPANS